MNNDHLHPEGRPYTKEEFVEKIKTDKEFAKRFGNLGKIYGFQWRNWNGNIDQISELIRLLKENPDSRRLLVSAWNPSDLPHQVLPPCHYGFQVYTRELTGEERWDLLKKKVGDDRFKLIVDDISPFGGGLSEELQSYNIPKRAISLMYNIRSQDVGLGWSFNVSSYSLLLMMIAKQVNMVPDELIMNIGDCHIYLNHIDGLREQIGRDLTDEERYNIWFDNNYETGMERYFDPNNLPNFDDDYYVPTPKRTREPYPLPTLKLSDRVVNDISEYTIDDIILENYKCHPAIKLPLSN